LKIVLSFGLGEFFDGVTQGRPWDFIVMCDNEAFDECIVFFSDFSEHSPYGFVDEIVGITKQLCCKLDREGKTIVFYELECADHRDSSVSKIVWNKKFSQ